jgi:thioredoxin 1
MHQDSPSTQISALRGSKALLLDFWAPWCQPCKVIAPEIERFAAANPHIEIVKINVDNEHALVKEWEVRTVPMLVYVPVSGAPRGIPGVVRAEELARRISD